MNCGYGLAETLKTHSEQWTNFKRKSNYPTLKIGWLDGQEMDGYHFKKSIWGPFH